MSAARDQRSLTEAFRQARLKMESAGRSKATADDYEEKLGLFRAYLGKELGHEATLADFGLAQAEEYMRVRRHGRTPSGAPRSDSTLAADARALRAISLWLERAQVTRTNRLAKLIVPEGTEDDGRILHDDELGTLFEVAGRFTWSERRSAAILACLLDGGIRVSELAALDADDYDPRTGALRVRHPAKRGRTRITALGRLGRELLAASRGTRRSSGPLFTEIGEASRRLTDAAVRSQLVRLSERAGVERVSPHDFRRTSTTRHHLNGMDPDLQRLTFGWSGLRRDARLRYLVLSEADRAALVAKTSPLDRLGLFDRRRAA